MTHIAEALHVFVILTPILTISGELFGATQLLHAFSKLSLSRASTFQQLNLKHPSETTIKVIQSRFTLKKAMRRTSGGTVGKGHSTEAFWKDKKVISECRRMTLKQVLCVIGIFLGCAYVGRGTYVFLRDREPNNPLPTSEGQILPNGAWVGKAGVYTDDGLKKALTGFFKQEDVKKLADYGARTGEYAKYFAENGLSVKCFDGNPAVKEISEGRCEQLDLSQRFEMEVFDWVMSIEVGEHIPNKFEDVFLDNLHRHNKHGIVLSWALPGQGGRGHVNEQDNDHIKGKMKSLGYRNDVITEKALRASSTKEYFRNTVMVFRKN